MADQKRPLGAPRSIGPYPDRQAQFVWLVLALLGFLLGIVGWMQWASGRVE